MIIHIVKRTRMATDKGKFAMRSLDAVIFIRVLIKYQFNTGERKRKRDETQEDEEVAMVARLTR